MSASKGSIQVRWDVCSLYKCPPLKEAFRLVCSLYKCPPLKEAFRLDGMFVLFINVRLLRKHSCFLVALHSDPYIIVGVQVASPLAKPASSQ